jgi:oxygen-independent coproporphyrinogen-3 oxidase
MSFGVYIHIPYCLQRCTYCDFATYEQSQILPPADYIQLVLEEMSQKLAVFEGQTIDTVYFGGGTPSLIPAEFIIDLLLGLEKHGLRIRPDSEKTIEINPATLDHKKMDLYLKSGINRFSVGAQSFDDGLLRMVHREHNAKQTRETLEFLKDYRVNYSLDLLFALPYQTLNMLRSDLDEVLYFNPPHVSPYCLTVPEGHVLTKNRPLEESQLEMFDLISRTLQAAGFSRYEISNFSKPGFESHHNSLYWDDSEYLGLGLSAHSYFNKSEQFGEWGTRLWNPSSIGAYEKQIRSRQGQRFQSILPAIEPAQFEKLEAHMALTDFCHISLRTQNGLFWSKLHEKFGLRIAKLTAPALNELVERGWLYVAALPNSDRKWALTEEGLVLSNQVFSALTYLRGEI